MADPTFDAAADTPAAAAGVSAADQFPFVKKPSGLWETITPAELLAALVLLRTPAQLRADLGLTDLATAAVGANLTLAGGVLSAAGGVWGAIAGSLASQADLAAALAAKAPLASPAFTGVPTAPTAAPGTNTTQLATAAFVKAAVDAAVAALVNAAPGTLDTFLELAAALGNDPNFATTILTALAGKASAAHTHPFADLTDGREVVEDYVAAMLTGGTHSGATVSYADNGGAAGTLNITVTSAATPGGSSGQVQFNSGGAFAGAAGVTYAPSGTHLTVAAQAKTDTPAVLQGAAGQTAPVLQVKDDTGAVRLSVNSAYGVVFGASGISPVFSFVGSGGDSGRLQWGDGSGWRYTFGGPAKTALTLTDAGGAVFGGAVSLPSGSSVANLGFTQTSPDRFVDFSDAGGGWSLSFRKYSGVARPNLILSDAVAGIAARVNTQGAGGVGVRVRTASGQTADAVQFADDSDAVVARFTANAAWRPPHLADAAAANDSVYFSTDAAKLAYKDGSGTVTPLY